MGLSVNIVNKGKGFLILGKGITQGFNHSLVAEIQYSINFIRPGIKFCLSLHYNRNNRFLFVNATKIYQLKAKDKNKNISTQSKIFQEIFQVIT